MKEIFEKTKQSLAVSFSSLDAKMTKLIPNPKLRKILCIGVGSLFGFMFLIIILGLFLSPLRTEQAQPTDQLKIILPTSGPKDKFPLTEIQKKILELETKIKDLRFPEGVLNVPLIESNITI